MVAAWCRCVSKEPSLVCPKCDSCFCSAPAGFKTAFWERAPRELWTHRQGLKRAKTTWHNPPPGEVQRPLVLIVDDDPVLRTILIAHAVAQGYGAVTAADGAEGLRMAQTYRPELVITDALMPQLDGREMARRIRRDAPKTRIVILTSVYTNAQHKYEALRDFGADQFLTKPVDARLLVDVLRRHLS